MEKDVSTKSTGSLVNQRPGTAINSNKKNTARPLIQKLEAAQKSKMKACPSTRPMSPAVIVGGSKKPSKQQKGANNHASGGGKGQVKAAQIN